MTHADPSTPPVTPRPAVPVSARAEALRDVIEAFYDAVYDYGWNTAEWQCTSDGRREHYALSDRVAACRARLDAELAALVQDAEDAERFRWLSAGNECSSLPSGRYTVWSGEADANYDGDSLRAAIDAARAHRRIAGGSSDAER